MACALAISRSWLDLSPPPRATTQSDHHCEPVFPAIDTVTPAAMDAKLDDFAAHWLAVAPVPQRQAGKSGQNLLLPHFVSQCAQPHVEIGSAQDLKHKQNVVYGLRAGK